MPRNPASSTWLVLGPWRASWPDRCSDPASRLPILAVAAGFVLAVLVRVTWETTADPTSHNLWPFEVAIAGFFGLLSGVIGVGLARGAQGSSLRDSRPYPARRAASLSPITALAHE